MSDNANKLKSPPKVDGIKKASSNTDDVKERSRVDLIGGSGVMGVQVSP